MSLRAVTDQGRGEVRRPLDEVRNERYFLYRHVSPAQASRRRPASLNRVRLLLSPLARRARKPAVASMALSSGPRPRPAPAPAVVLELPSCAGPGPSGGWDGGCGGGVGVGRADGVASGVDACDVAKSALQL